MEKVTLRTMLDLCGYEIFDDTYRIIDRAGNEYTCTNDIDVYNQHYEYICTLEQLLNREIVEMHSPFHSAFVITLKE